MRRMLCLLAAAGCADNQPPDPVSPPTIEYLSPTDHLVRAAMALRGKRPTLAELEAVAADPGALPAIVDGYLETPEFGSVMRDLHAETLLVRVDQPFMTFKSIGPVADRTAGEINANVFEEPLRLIEHVIVNDRPYSEIVTADYAIAEPISAAIWGMTIHADGRASWNDGRPVSGILSSSGLYARHQSAGSNYNRGRANTISRALLCFDFLHGDINIDTSVDLANPEAVKNALRENSACVGCHQTLDPLATTIFGFQKNARYTSYPVPMWRADWVDDWIGASDRPPAYFGLAAENVRDVGARISEDPRFPRCAARRFAAYFTQTKEVSFAWIARLTDVFIQSQLSAKQLAREIVLSDEFRVSHVNGLATADEAEALHGMLHTRPEQLDSLFEDLTGFRWLTDSMQQINGVPYGRANLLRTDFLGFRALAGGIDGYFVTEPTHTTNAVSSLLLRTLSATAAGFVVDNELSGGPKRLLTDVTETTIDEPAIRAQLAKLHARIYGTLDAAESDAVGETYALFAAVIARGDGTRAAWKTTLTAMLGDLRVAHY